MSEEASDSKVPKVEVSSSPEEDKFWIKFGSKLVSKSINVLDDRAKFMITTAASLLAIDFAVLVFKSRATAINVSPQFFFALSTLFFIISLFPRHYLVNPWTPDETKTLYREILDHKYNFHKIGFAFFFIALILVALTSLV